MDFEILLDWLTRFAVFWGAFFLVWTLCDVVAERMGWKVDDDAGTGTGRQGPW